MAQQSEPGVRHDETDHERLGKLLDSNGLSLDLVSAYAGDRKLTPDEAAFVNALRARREEHFFSDLLYAVTHQYFPPGTARDQWHDILRHKYFMSSAMKRNIGIAVAALDYLTNLTSELTSATVIGEAHMADIVRLSLRDGLTGLFNHTCCYQRLDSELRRFVQAGTAVSLLLMDLDDFKLLNDTYGHQDGDRVLTAIGRLITQTARDSDICCRYGGEEFAVIMPAADTHAACALAGRLQAALVQNPPDGKPVTVSVGVACATLQCHTSPDLVRKADEALYKAKASGKNCVMTAE
jgi:diguanylate cyclase (GGDEF)-like protein